MNDEELREFRSRFGIPISDEKIADAPFHKLPENSPEMQYLQERRQKLGGFVPLRNAKCTPLITPSEDLFAEFYEGTGEREIATTMALVRLLSKLMKDDKLGKLIVPIVPDEARTFGMESLFRQVGIYSHVGQLYEPVDKETLLYYKEAQNGQILEEGISEAGAISSFIAAGTSYATQCVNTIPFFLFYSMFGFQRIGDLIWAAGDSRCRGFLIGGTSGRTTLAGEGLQHQDGNSQLLAYPLPNLLSYDPAFAYEIAVIVREGIRRMYEEQESVFYYLTVMNEFYPMPPMPPGVQEGILKGMYRFRASENKRAKLRAQLFGSGAILREALRAQKMLEEQYGVAADVWSVTSYKELYKEGHEVERWNMLHPMERPRIPYVAACLADAPGIFVAASDYVKALPDSVARWFPRPLVSLGTDGFGRSDTREALRGFFEVDARTITFATLSALAREKQVGPEILKKAMVDLGIDPDKPNPMTS
jgi:pyruvate dehydrogenase E1 component